jgi:citrate synthase
VTVENLLGGMRGLKALLCQTSELDPVHGIMFRNYTIPAMEERFPKRNAQPLPEGILHLMLTGEMPTEKDVRDMSLTLYSRA